MRAPWLGPGLVGAALLVHFGLARPAEREAAHAQEETLRLGREKRALGARRFRLEQSRASRLRAPRPEGGAKPPADAVARLRLALLEPLAGQAVTGVRLTVVPGAPPLAAEGRVRAEGTFGDLVSLSGRLVRPGSGLVLRRAQLTSGADGGLVLELDVFTLAEGGR